MISESAGGGLAPALREWRTRRRVSQLELATRAGTTQRHVSFIESGRSSPGRSMIIRLAESLEVPIRERTPDDRLRVPGRRAHRPRDAPDHLGFAVPLRLRAPGPADGRELTLITTLTHFGTAVDVTVAELRLEAFLPADRETADLLAELHRT
ncbi:helix-turn-helix transcriptional regulator [Streptomyces sp. SID7909]|uniref:helix-turn-helix domain-containing protein n=1 Tax=Streptomyces sp. SID7909 TaxID=2706092 RepID=UPI0013BB97AA|nr:helix-turn-helix transcriptional regulator [Streptomyces sp. SID7909]